MSPIAANLQAIRRRISEALQGDSRDISIVAVAKGQSPEAIRAAFAAGCRDFGESYSQEALPKIAKLRDLGVTWHFIGHLQGNKARDVAQAFDWVHGLDRVRVAITAIACVELHDHFLIRIAEKQIPGRYTLNLMKIVRMRMITNPHPFRLEFLSNFIEQLGALHPFLL